MGEAADKSAIAEKADKKHLEAKKEADVKEGKAKIAHNKEVAAKKASKDQLAEEAREAALPPAAIPTCSPGECLAADNTCKETNGVSAPFMGADLVHCSDTAPAMDPNSGLAAAGVPPPPPPPPVVPSALCKEEMGKCVADAKCKALCHGSSIAATKTAGCDGS